MTAAANRPDINLTLQILTRVTVPPRLEAELQSIVESLLHAAACPLRTGNPADCKEALIRVSVLLDVVGESVCFRHHVAMRLRDGQLDLLDVFIALGGEQRTDPPSGTGSYTTGSRAGTGSYTAAPAAVPAADATAERV